MTLPDPALPWPLPMPAVAMIAEREGCRLKAYRCVAGVLTCGYGETDGITPTTQWTQAEADKRLCDSLTRYALHVAAMCEQHPMPNQLGALTSLAYNIGLDGLKGSTVLRCHNRGDWQAASRAFGLWNKARVNGVLTELAGLTARRAAEAALYLAPEPDDQHERMPQAVESESSLASSPINKGGIVAAGTGVIGALSSAGESVGGLATPIGHAKEFLVGTLGLSPSLIPFIVLVAVGGAVIWWRAEQRKQGWV